jgi:hypothetical protein
MHELWRYGQGLCRQSLRLRLAGVGGVLRGCVGEGAPLSLAYWAPPVACWSLLLQGVELDINGVLVAIANLTSATAPGVLGSKLFKMLQRVWPDLYDKLLAAATLQQNFTG